jgi:hypothetical protein
MHSDCDCYCRCEKEDQEGVVNHSDIYIDLSYNRQWIHSYVYVFICMSSKFLTKTGSSRCTHTLFCASKQATETEESKNDWDYH